MAHQCTRVEMRTTNTHIDRTLKPNQRGITLTVGRHRINIARTGLSVIIPPSKSSFGEYPRRRWWLQWSDVLTLLKANGTPY